MKSDLIQSDFVKSLAPIALVGAGGFLGSLIRQMLYNLSSFLANNLPFLLDFNELNLLPTFMCNILACFLIGLVTGYKHLSTLRIPHSFLLFFSVGFLGSLSTYSTFVSEFVLGIQHGHPLALSSYVLLSFAFGICAVYLGFNISKAIKKDNR